MAHALVSSTSLFFSTLSPAPRCWRARRIAPAREVVCCSRASSSPPSSKDDRAASRRNVLVSSGFLAATTILARPRRGRALLETDEDESLLEKVKEDRKKRIERRGAVASLKDEKESVQRAVLELSKAGQAIDGDDYGLAGSVLANSAWIADLRSAIAKLNKSSEEEDEAANFSTALQKLQSAVVQKDAKSSKSAFVASANALEKWSSLTGLSEEIKGL